LTRRRISLFLLVIGAAGNAWAQVSPPLPSETRPGEKPLPLPEFRKPAPELIELPPVKPPEAGRVPLGVRATVRKFRITGNTAISDAELAKVAAPFENRELGTAELEELRRQLTLLYVSRGYINSGAVIPDQRIAADGVIVIKAQQFRSQEQNKADALDRLADLIRRASFVPKPRKATKPTRSSQARRLDSKAKHARLKRGRRVVED